MAGANTDHSGETFIKLAWNPIYLEPATPFRNKMPTWGVEIVCDGDCNGLPCAIDPAKHNVNEMDGGNTIGAGGANFCVVTVPKGATANFVVFEGGLSGDDTGSGGAPSTSLPPVNHPSTLSSPHLLSPTGSLSNTPSTAPTSPPQPYPTATPAPTSTRALTSSASSTSSTSSTASTVPSSFLSLSLLSSTVQTPSSSSSSISSPNVQTSSSSSWSPSLPSLAFSAVGTTSIYTSSTQSSASHNHATTSSSFKHLITQSVANTTSESKYHHTATPLPSPTFSYRPHIFVENRTATLIGHGHGHSASPIQSPTLQSTYPGPPAGTTGAGYNTQVTLGAFSLTVVAAIAVIAL